MEQANTNSDSRLTDYNNTDQHLHGWDGRAASPATRATADQLQLDVDGLVSSTINAILRSASRQNAIHGQTDLYSCILATSRTRILLPERGRLHAREKHVVPLPRTETLHPNRSVADCLSHLHWFPLHFDYNCVLFLYYTTTPVLLVMFKGSESFLIGFKKSCLDCICWATEYCINCSFS